MSKQTKADLMLLLATLFWGTTYYFISISLTELDPINLIALRFALAFIITGTFSLRRLRGVNRETLKYAAVLGTLLVSVYVTVSYGVKYTSISNAGFLCSLTVITTPIVAFIFLKQRPEKKLIIVIFLALIGVAFLTLTERTAPALGDIICILSSLSYSVHILVTEAVVKKENVDAFQIGVLQLGFCSLWLILLTFVFEKPTIPQSGKVWGAILFLAVFCTGIAFIIQAVAQKYTKASHFGVIFSFSPVFAGMTAYFAAGEILHPREYLGAAILICSLFIMEINFTKIPSFFKNKRLGGDGGEDHYN
ncbi:MAG: DMT family transporter [Anaerovoracaceae bacterium]|jgi:drug/metabolite transporter (DMT)-like permease